MTVKDIYALMSDASRPFVSWLVSLVDRLFTVEARADELAARIRAIEDAIDDLDKRTKPKR